MQSNLLFLLALRSCDPRSCRATHAQGARLRCYEQGEKPRKLLRVIDANRRCRHAGISRRIEPSAHASRLIQQRIHALPVQLSPRASPRTSPPPTQPTIKSKAFPPPAARPTRPCELARPARLAHARTCGAARARGASQKVSTARRVAAPVAALVACCRARSSAPLTRKNL